MSQASATSLDRKARGTRKLGKVDVVVIVPLLEEFLAVQKHIAFEPVEEEACPPILADALRGQTRKPASRCLHPARYGQRVFGTGHRALHHSF